jgi:FkbM family methyltransferase
MPDPYVLLPPVTPAIYIHQNGLDFDLLNERFFLFGAGNNTVRFLTELAHSNRPVIENVLCIADSDPAKQGGKLLGISIISPEDLLRHPRLHPWDMYPKDTLVIITPMHGVFDIYYSLKIAGFTKVTHYEDSIAETFSHSSERHIEYLAYKSQLGAAIKDKRVDFVKEHLGDDISRGLVDAVIEGYINDNWGGVEKYYTDNLYAPSDIFKLSPNEVIVDCGAFDLASLRTIIRQGGGFQYAYAFEPEPMLFTLCEYNKRLLKEAQNIELHDIGVWSKPSRQRFLCVGGGKSKIREDGKISIKCDSLDNLLLEKPHRPTYIKIDVVESELETLKGMTEIIKRDHPKLAIALYHKPRDIWELPLYLMEKFPEYKYFIRQHWYHTKTVLYAVLDKKA